MRFDVHDFVLELRPNRFLSRFTVMIVGFALCTFGVLEILTADPAPVTFALLIGLALVGLAVLAVGVFRERMDVVLSEETTIDRMRKNRQSRSSAAMISASIVAGRISQTRSGHLNLLLIVLAIVLLVGSFLLFISSASRKGAVADTSTS